MDVFIFLPIIKKVIKNIDVVRVKYDMIRWKILEKRPHVKYKFFPIFVKI